MKCFSGLERQLEFIHTCRSVLGPYPAYPSTGYIKDIHSTILP